MALYYSEVILLPALCGIHSKLLISVSTICVSTSVYIHVKVSYRILSWGGGGGGAGNRMVVG